MEVVVPLDEVQGIVAHPQIVPDGALGGQGSKGFLRRGFDNHLASLDPAGATYHHLCVPERLDRESGGGDELFCELGTLNRKLEVPFTLVHCFDIFEEFSGEFLWLIIHDPVMNATKQDQVFERVSFLLRLFGIVPRPTGTLGSNVANFPCYRPGRLHNRRRAARISTAVARKCKDPLNGSIARFRHSRVRG